MKIKRLATVALCAALAVSVTACGTSQKEDETTSKYTFAMNTVMNLEAFGEGHEEALEQGIAEINRLDKMLSSETEGSDIYELNRTGSAEVTEETSELIEKSKKVYDETDESFDISVYPLSKLWGFIDEKYYLPTENEIAEKLPLVDSGEIKVSGGENGKARVEFGKDGMQITLGAIAKGYTSSRIIEIFKENGIKSAAVSLGGNVQVLGTRPDGKEWRVGIKDPENTESTIGVVSLTDKAVVTSGAYERFFEKDGVKYGHVLDPKTGYPVDNGILSVTIVSEDGTLADALSTALFVMGVKSATEFYRSGAEEFDFIIEDESGKIYVTEGIADSFESEHEIVKVEK